MISASLYMERLSRGDLAFLAENSDFGLTYEAVRSDPRQIPSLLERPGVFRRLFRSGRDEPLLLASPFLVFSVLIARAAADLREASHVPEWMGPGKSLPVFDVENLRDFIGEDLRRLFLADVLSSYTRVAGGVLWVQTGTGWRRRRFSELDPGQLAQLILDAPAAERLPLYRRLGDLSLFLTGVFPDHVANRLLGPIHINRIERALGIQSEAHEPGTLELLEEVGRRAYSKAYEATIEPRIGMARVLGEIVDRFQQGRRILNLITERYLFPLRQGWFPNG